MLRTATILIGCSLLTCLRAQQVSSASETASPSAAASAVIVRRHVDPGFMYQRVYARVPMVGAGTPADPRRPMFAPVPGQAVTAAANAHTGILGFQMQISDDGKSALCEFVGATLKDLDTIISSTDPNVKVFVRGKDSPADILADFQQYKKTFNFQLFASRPQ